MQDRLDAMRNRVRQGEHRRHRQATAPDVLTECEAEGLASPARVARLVRRMCEAQTPVILEGERIAFTRTTPETPPIYAPQDWDALTAGRQLHELGPISNICADWGMVIGQGLLQRREVAVASRGRLADDAEACAFLDAAVETIDAVLDLAARYAEHARSLGRDDLASRLERVPAHPARTFAEALQSLRLVHAVTWLSGHYHVGLGRFDQFMWPYLEADLEAGRETEASAEALLAEFIISLNKDSDLFPGVQQGDNGQTLTLGGMRPDGGDGVNALTWMALRVARDVSMIDPKINLRIHADTDLALLDLAAELTLKGLGFPQYSNDDVVIPALVAHGYRLEDARNYTVAACWEFIIPGWGMDVVNIGAVSFPAAADRGIRAGLARAAQSGPGSWDDVQAVAAADIRQQVASLVDRYRTLLLPPAPWYSVVMGDCLEQGRDLSQGLRYNNFGIHGAASADAADALAAVKRFVFDEKAIDATELLDAMDADYVGHERLQARLAHRGPHVGAGDPEADTMLGWLFDTFAASCEGVGDNGRGGIVRPGTGSAMYYVWLARGHEGMFEPVVGATANGRNQGAFFSANLSPAHNARVPGATSVLRSFNQIDYERVCNGGPITLELADVAFRDEHSRSKIAQLTHSFAALGCHQLQLNTVNLDTLRDAQAHPELHRNLIVRVWGWSAYFVDLEPEYQEHVMERQMHAVM